MTDLYAMADRAIKSMNRENLKAFGRLKLARWDEINVVRAVGTVYDESAALARKRYLEIAKDAYIRAMVETGKTRKEAERDAWEDITMLWLLGLLEAPDPVTLYIFTEETERKKQRLVEALSAAHNKNAEIDKALRYWTKQVGQYAINVTDDARLDAFRSAGVERVMWNTNLDGRECERCKALNGKVFDIDKVPPKQHYGDRCWLTPVLA